MTGGNGNGLPVLTAKDFIFTDGKVVFFEKKGK